MKRGWRSLRGGTVTLSRTPSSWSKVRMTGRTRVLYHASFDMLVLYARALQCIEYVPTSSSCTYMHIGLTPCTFSLSLSHTHTHTHTRIFLLSFIILYAVGAARDKACHIEGTLHSIETKKRWYNKRLTELPLLEKKYASDLGVAMKECGGYPVIGPSPEEASGVNKVDDNDDKNANENKAEASIRVTATDAADDRSRETSPKTTTAYADDDGAAHTSPVRHLSEMTPRTPVTPAAHASPGHNSIIDCSPFTIDNSEIGPFVLSEDSEAGMRPLQIQPNLAPQPLQRQDSNNIVSNFSLGCGFLAGNSYLEHQEDESLVGLSFDSAIDVDRSTHSSSRPNPRSPERVVNRPPEYPRTPDRSFGGLGGGGTASFDTVESSSRVDFRSGYSGHRGLLGAKSHADRMKAEQSRREFRTMGEHRGIGYINSRGIGVASVPSRVGTASSSSRTDRSRASRMSDAR
mmetsp:Transcript_37890/g.77120  ORF Transcript_37890/g.77120 Transcript_37890/m.77120 type:complete len:460 (+) Transcript_37890:391-1770(+)